MTIILSVILFLIIKVALDPPKLPSVLYFFGLLAFAISIDGNDFGLWEHMYVYDHASNTNLVYFYFLCYFAAYFLFCLMMFRGKGKNQFQIRMEFDSENVIKLRRAARFIAVISIFATVINLSRAGDISQMITAPRLWEKSFGKYVLLNYCYFLHLCAIPLFICLFKVDNFATKKIRVNCKANKLDYLLFFSCICMSFFHGIKFTVLHAFVYAAFAFYIFSDFKISKTIIFLCSMFFIFIFSFFTFVRGGGVDGLIGYLTSSSVNSIYLINVNEFYEMGSFGSLFPFFDTSLLDRVLERLTSDFQARGVSAESGFFLNDKFNLYSAITTISLGGPLAFIFWSIVLGLFFRVLYRVNSVFKCFLLIHVLNVCLMMFTAWEFYKFKLLYVLMVSYFISKYIEKRGATQGNT